MLFLEGPIGTGYSYTEAEGDVHRGDNSTALDNLNFMREFLGTHFPQYADHQFYIAGESYAGIYIPTLATVRRPAISR